jgi:predicted RNase H-like HicB family nuclease
MIGRYVERALRKARYVQLEDGSYCATVPGLRGVVATGASVETCREQLAEVIEAWVLVRVSRGLAVPAIGGATVHVKKAS